MDSPETRMVLKTTDRGRRSLGFAVLPLLAAIAVLAGCGASGFDRPDVEASAVTKEGVQVATVSLHSFYYEPNRVVVKVGVPVELRLTKKSLFVPHNFSLHAPEAGIEINRNVGTLMFFPGSATVRFTPTKPGEYEFSCGKHHHAAKGMQGTLVVKP